MDVFQKAFDYTVADELKARGLYPYFRAIETGNDTEVYINKKKMLMLGSNSYMGLTFNEITIKAAIEGVKKHGTGCAGSRFLNGTLDLHEDLELKLANFMNRESALLFSTGLLTNQGILSTLIGRNDIVYIDKSDHASIIDGVRLSFSKVIKFKHNDMDDLKKHLANSSSKAGKLIVVDGVFSMEGDLADLPNIVELAKTYGARVMVDEAHAVGVLGKNGRGASEHFGLEEEISIIMATFSKSFATIGGFAASSGKVIDYLKHRSRALIFTASLPPAVLGAAEAALTIIQNEPERRKRLFQIAQKMRLGFTEIGYDVGATVTPIVPLIIGDMDKCFMLWKEVTENGIFVNPVVPPGVPEGQSLIRTSYIATHTDEQLDFALDVFKKVGKKLGLI
ncbi:MAG TPA: pyridoxal phosphate-dependent aminotransferase family protein [Spirochaetes bacterium]|nr:pyridoxal phosphate-dependent aminotransferase family protein [Spirochaetota bacterium]